MSCIKSLSAAAALALLVLPAAGQTTITTNFTGVNKVIPDGQATGVADTHAIDFGTLNFSQITDLKLNVTISGGFNGDYYGYLVHDSGFAVVFNRPGVASTNSAGYSNTGFDITLADSGNDVHFYNLFTPTFNGSGQLTGTWAPDGRNVDPATVGEPITPTALLGSFGGGDPNGTWTLFLSDLDFGEQGTLVNWGLIVTAIPEPTTWALLGTGGALLAWRRRRLK